MVRLLRQTEPVVHESLGSELSFGEFDPGSE